MKSKTSALFWKCFRELPDEIKKEAKKAYRQFQEDPYQPSLRFKRIHSRRPIFSLRVAKEYRAVGVQEDVIVWFWIGSHSDYDKLVRQIRKR